MFKLLWKNRESFFRDINRYKKNFWKLEIMQILNSIIFYTIPILNMKIVNGVVDKIQFDYIIRYFLMYILVAICGSVNSYLHNLEREQSKLNFIQSKQKNILTNIIETCNNQEYEQGDIDVALKQDIIVYQEFLYAIVLDFPILCIRILVSLGLMLYLSWDVAIVVLILQGISVVFEKKMNVIMERNSLLLRKKLGNFSGYLNQLISIISLIKPLGAIEYIENMYRYRYTEYKKEMLKIVKVQGKTIQILRFLEANNVFIVLFIGGIKVWNKRMKIGALFSVIQYSNMFFEPMLNLFNILTSYGVQHKQIRNVLLFEKKSSNLQVLPGFKNLKDININSLKFGYNKRIIFDDANIILEKGKINYILGKSGVGKTTFAKILCGNLKKAEGYIKIENCKYNLKNIDLNNSISIVPQENIIFEDTVYNNLVMHNQNILFDTVKRVCTECEIYCDILNMSKGFNTKIDGSLSTLSGGQLKRIALARAILQSKEILIVDEPTAGLDMESAKKIGVLLKKYATMKIIIVITHDRNIIFNNQNTYIIKNRMFYKIEKDIEE